MRGTAGLSQTPFPGNDGVSAERIFLKATRYNTHDSHHIVAGYDTLGDGERSGIWCPLQTYTRFVSCAFFSNSHTDAATSRSAGEPPSRQATVAERRVFQGSVRASCTLLRRDEHQDMCPRDSCIVPHLSLISALDISAPESAAISNGSLKIMLFGYDSLPGAGAPPQIVARQQQQQQWGGAGCLSPAVTPGTEQSM